MNRNRESSGREDTIGEPTIDSDAPVPHLIQRIRIRNYKSIRACDVALGPVTLLVGRNGAGKSNFLDAIRFVSDALGHSLDKAIADRFGLDSILPKCAHRPRDFSIRVDTRLIRDYHATFEFEVARAGRHEFEVRHERMGVSRPPKQHGAAWYSVDSGVVSGPHFLVRDPTGGTVPIERSKTNVPPQPIDQLFLVQSAEIDNVFRICHRQLTSTAFYNFNPEMIKKIQTPEPGHVLRYDGGNLASVIDRLYGKRPDVFARLLDYLRIIYPPIRNVRCTALGPQETLEFELEGATAEERRQMFAWNMSNGTLLALAALTASVQPNLRVDLPLRVVGIEEPETALHPAAAGVLMDALREAALRTQIIVTTHSPDLLDHLDLETDTLLVVEAKDGETIIGRPNAVSRDAIKNHLYTAGDLLRMDQLEPDPQDILSAQSDQISQSSDSGEIED